MMNAGTIAIATLTVMLWILWSDSMRSRRPSQIVYTMRIALFLVASAILILNMVRYPSLFAGGARALAIAAVVVGVLGAGYFARKLALRR